jgi:hypothetical protein
MPLTSRNILVEMVARAGIEPATFRFSVTHFAWVAPKIQG